MATPASVKDLTMEDVKDHLASVKDTTPHFDILVAVAGRALEILEAAAAPPPSAAAKDGQPSSSSRQRSSGDGGEASSSSKKGNSGNLGEASSASPASRNRKTKRKEKSPPPPPPTPPPPPLPREFERAIQDRARGRSVTAPRLVIQKELFATDVATHNNRLSIPIRQIKDDFLTAEERQKVENKTEEPLKVMMVSPSLEWEEEVKFSQWDMPKDNRSKMSSSYVIIGAWKEVVRKNGLRKGVEVQLWSFRIDQDLGFALVRLN